MMTWENFLFDLGISMLHIYSIICNWINVTKQAIAVAVGYSSKLTANMQDTLDKETLTPEIQNNNFTQIIFNRLFGATWRHK